jgi:NAD(P)-dependent dehydrogenase (short-subunit alcohol dehydrogenase family)
MPQHILIIGANRGIGLELTKRYLERGELVTAACRKASPELLNLNCDILEGIDVTCDDSVNAMVTQLSSTKIDVLIHNSGILRSDSYPDISIDRMREHFEVNSLGPLRTIMALEHLLDNGSKVGIVSSRVGSIDDNTSSNNYAYRTSKTAVNMIGKCLSIDLKPKGVAVALLHPGYVRTDMTRHNGLIEADEAAIGLITRMDELTLDQTGCFVHANGEVLTW